ncbi:SAM-dependent methyltransferase [Aliikangiella coralliicola]|uniref:Tetrapyrrole methylase domain-containing protein n=1 Tax=Aliikangiella coralliicola TaxID=2592383 RepID=A0A545U4V9_9GAMM|nr:SAM-dependent methyltransferase [Aliikangiella coralliicola]TQV84511.1 hypothetical protein FLL46_23135 [Aliikangiella coralliicola]
MVEKDGGLVFVGTGILLGGHMTPRAREYITNADIVFMSVSSGIMEAWISDMNQDVRSLQVFYKEEVSRKETYNSMVNAILSEVRDGKRVCCVLYGHPGVFAYVSHRAIELARNEGFTAKMEPGISAEDCLVADLGIDPGKYGCQQYEATQFMLYQRKIDPSAYLILWQIGVAGDISLKKLETKSSHRKILLELLSEHYPDDHEVIVYEASSLPLSKTRIEKIPLNHLIDIKLHDYSTLVIPPSLPLSINSRVEEKLRQFSY